MAPSCPVAVLVRRVCGALCIVVLATALPAQELFNVPVRINMGGPETVDSYGRTWLGDREDCADPQNADPLDIRPQDDGGGQSICDWEIGNFDGHTDKMDELGFDSQDPGDRTIFNTIRWDQGGSAPDFINEIPIPNGIYHVNLYFNEGCCTGRHFKIELQDEIVAEDVSYESYDDFPALGRMGVLSFEDIEVVDNVMKIAFLPCPSCPGVSDVNAIIDAIEIITSAECDHLGMDFLASYNTVDGIVEGSWNRIGGADSFRLLRNGQPLGEALPATARDFVDPAPQEAGTPGVTYTVQAFNGASLVGECSSFVKTFACPGNFECEVTPGDTEVVLSWDAGGGLDISGFEIRRNGELIETTGPGETIFEDEPGVRDVVYTLTPISDPPGECGVFQCTAIVDGVPFGVPLRINMGGVETVDSLGRTWLGDGPGTGDPLGIRPEDASGTNTIENWNVGNFQPETFEKLGLDPDHPGDFYIFNTIRWDDAGDGDLFNFLMEIPIPDGEYVVNMYFTEGCCTNRHFKIELQEELVDEDVSYLDYDPNPGLGRTGLLSFPGIEVDDGILRIGLLPCFECPGGGDGNAIIDALEILPGTFDPCMDPDNPDFRACPAGLTCEVAGDGAVTGEWNGPECFEVEGYELRRDGELIQTLPADATAFSDESGLSARFTTYSLTPLVAEGVEPCGVLSCRVVDEEVPFPIPVRINMGGVETVDSFGNTWLGDGPGPGDILGIRPNDLGGTNTIENWGMQNFQPDSFDNIGFDPDHPGDRYIFNTIRWDNGGDADDFRLEIPVPDGEYDVNCYFTEGCCTGRHFKIEIEEEIVDDDVSYLDYDEDLPDLGRSGVLEFPGIEVFDGFMSIGFLPCPECIGASDTNAIIDAIEILGEPTVQKPLFNRADPNDDATSNIADSVFILSNLFSGGADPTCRESADVNDDGSVNITDPISLLTFLFGGEQQPVPPAAPGTPASPCGPDPEGSVDLGCDSYTSCE